MKINLGDFIRKTGSGVALSEAERAKMRGMLSEYMSMKPVRANADARPASALHGWYFLMRKPVAIALIALLVVSVSGAGVSYAAEGALPGDILYSVKVGVNEPVETALAVTAEAKAAVSARHAVARLNEASALAAKGKLTAATEEKLAAAFEKQADDASARVDALQAKDSPAAIAVASDFESELSAHVDVLDEVGPQTARTLRTVALAKARVFSGIRASAERENDVSNDSDSGAVAVAATVSAKTAAPMAFMALRAGVATSASNETASVPAPAVPAGAGKEAASRMAHASKETLSETDALFIKLSSRLSFDEAAQATTTVAGARAGIAAADASFASGEYISAFHAYQDAFVSLTKLEVFMKTSARDGIRVRTEPLPAEVQILPADVSSVSASSSGSAESEVENVPPPTLQILPFGTHD